MSHRVRQNEGDHVLSCLKKCMPCFHPELRPVKRCGLECFGAVPRVAKVMDLTADEDEDAEERQGKH